MATGVSMINSVKRFKEAFYGIAPMQNMKGKEIKRRKFANRE